MTTDWRHQAVCRDYEPEIFHPHPSDLDGRRAAISICNTCPVIEQCRRYSADPTKVTYGVWGGRFINREHGRNPPKEIEHGTNKGYKAHWRREEEQCDACRRAAAERRAYYRARKATG